MKAWQERWTHYFCLVYGKQCSKLPALSFPGHNLKCKCVYCTVRAGSQQFLAGLRGRGTGLLRAGKEGLDRMQGDRA